MTKQNQPRRFTCTSQPSHYDDDGYVIQWFVPAIPRYLAVLYGWLTSASNEKHLARMSN